MKQHDGYITAMSALGKGTTFNIYLPLTDRATLSEAIENIAPARGEETILVIEDDNDVRTMMATILSGHGYTVLEAADGEEAITVFNEHGKAIDLVIADVVMPGRNGKEVLDEIARIDPSVKSVFISGYTGDIVLEKGVRKDTVDFLHKPVSLTKLLTKVRAVLDRPDAGRKAVVMPFITQIHRMRDFVRIEGRGAIDADHSQQLILQLAVVAAFNPETSILIDLTGTTLEIENTGHLLRCAAELVRYKHSFGIR